MRNELKAHIDKGGEGLSPLFLEAMADYFKGPKSPLKVAPPSKDRRGQLTSGTECGGVIRKKGQCRALPFFIASLIGNYAAAALFAAST